MVKRPVNQKLIGKDYIGVIEAEGVTAYNVLKQHFGESDLLHKLRNTIAYHHPAAQELEAAFEDVPEDEDWAWYPSDTINNSFYLASDMVISAGILRATGKTDTAEAFAKIMGMVMSVSNVMTDFFLYLMRAIVSRHLGDDVLSPHIGTGTKIENAPNLYKFAIPFFTVRRRKRRRSHSFGRLLSRLTKRDEVERLQHIAYQIAANRFLQVLFRDPGAKGVFSAGQCKLSAFFGFLELATTSTCSASQ